MIVFFHFFHISPLLLLFFIIAISTITTQSKKKKKKLSNLPRLLMREKIASALLDMSKTIEFNDNIYFLISNNKNNDTANTLLSSLPIFTLNTTIFNSLLADFLVNKLILKPSFGKFLMCIVVFFTTFQKLAGMIQKEFEKFKNYTLYFKILNGHLFC